MIRAAPHVIAAERVTVLPDHFHWRGEPAAWTRMTRPGMALHSFLEGPCFDGERLMVADVPHGRIFAICDGEWSVAWDWPGEPHAIRPCGHGFAVADHSLGLLALNRVGRSHTILVEGQRFTGLSDLVVARDGGIWFTDSGRSSLSDPSGRVWYRAPDGTVGCVLDRLAYPNGIALDPAERFVYVACTRANAVLRFATGGAETPPMTGIFLQLSGGLGPDGLAVDKAGRIAVAQAQAGRVYLFDAVGDPLADIRVSGNWTTAVAFAPDGALMIVEAQEGAIWRVASEVIERL